MIRTTTRVMGAILIALFGLSTVHLSAADNILPVATFGDELDSIALNTLMQGTTEDPLFTDEQIGLIDRCTVTHFAFKTGVNVVTAGPMDLDDPEGTSPNDPLVGVACTIAGTGSGKILTVNIPSSSGSGQIQGVAKITLDPEDPEVEDDPDTPDVDEGEADAKVIAQKVLHNVVAKESIVGVCDLKAGTPPTRSMSVNIDKCDVSDLFTVQVKTDATFTYTVDSTNAMRLGKVGTTNEYMLTDAAGAANVTVTAQAMKGTPKVAHGAAPVSAEFSFTGTAGRSIEGAKLMAITASPLSLALGETHVTPDVGSWFILADQTEPGNEVRFTATSSPKLEHELDVTTVFSAFDHDNDDDTPDRLPGVYADLEVKAIGVTGMTQTANVTVTATQGSGDDAVKVSVTRKHKVTPTEVFLTLVLKLPDEWKENTSPSLGDLNEAIAANIKDEIGDDDLDVDYSISSDPGRLFELKSTEEGEVIVTDGAPTVEWAESKKVPSYEGNEDGIEITLTATPGGGSASEDLMITVGIEDVNDDPVVDTESDECEDVEDLDELFVQGADQHTILNSVLEGKALACVSDEDTADEIEAAIGVVTPTCGTDSADDDITVIPEGTNICIAKGEESVVIHTRDADVAGTTTETIKIEVTVTSDEDEVDFNFTKKVVVLTGSNTAPRFPGGSSQVMVDKFKETTKIMSVGPAEADAWKAADVNASGTGLDEVTHMLQGANAKGILNGYARGYCLKANSSTGAVSTSKCSSAPTEKRAGIDFEKTGASFSVNLIASDKFGGSATLEIVVNVTNEPDSPIRTDEEVPTDVIALTPKNEMHEVDLGDFFEDPDGLPLEFEVSSSADTIAGASVAGGMLTITAGTAGGAAEITATLTGPFDEGEMLEDEDDASIEFSVTNLVLSLADNNKPEFANGLAAVEYSVPEVSATAVGAPHAVENGAEGSNEALYDTLTYEIIGSDKFSVDETTGQITSIEEKLDYEDTQLEVFHLRVTDIWGENDTLKVSVSVTNVNEPPVVTEYGMNLPSPMVVAGGMVTLNLRDAFEDQDKVDSGQLLISHEVSHPRVEVVIDEDDVAQITGHSAGAAVVTLTARDSAGHEVSEGATFNVTVVENAAPIVANAIPDDEVIEGYIGDTVVNDVFSDPNESIGDEVMVVSASSSNAAAVVAVLTADHEAVTIIARAIGAATVTVTAEDSSGASVSDEFDITVVAEPPPPPEPPVEPENNPPMVANALSGVTIVEGETADVDVSGVFTDADGDDLTLSATTSDADLAALSPISDAGMMTITAGMLVGDALAGTADVTVTASDGEDSASDTFTVVVLRDNTAPSVAQTIDPQFVTRGNDPINLDVSGVFIDEDPGDSLTLTYSVADGTIVGATLDDLMVNMGINGLAPGTTTVTLMATDMYDESAETFFDVTVDTRPEAIGSISPVALEIGGEGFELEIGGLFKDDDGDSLSYETSLTTLGIVDESMSGMSVMLSPASRGSTMLTVTATDDAGYAVSVSGSISVGDGEIRKVAAQSLAGYGRSVLSSVSASVGSRVLSGTQNSDLSLASTVENFIGSITTNGNVSGNDVDALEPSLWSTTDQRTNTTGTGSGQSALSALGLSGSQSFAMKLNAAEGAGAWSVWGTTDRQNFEGTSYEGMASSVYLGVDVQSTECLLIGVAMSRNSGEIDYGYGDAEQSMDTNLTTVLPYFRYEFDPITTIWGVAGMGSGDVDSTVVGTTNQTSDMSMNIYMFGARRGLNKVGNVDLALRGDIAVANLETDSGDGAVDGLIADISRIRAGFEGSYTVDTGSGTFTPFADVNLRQDGGDGDTGTGVEVSGGIRLNVSSFNLEARGRVLASHGADDYAENGFSLTATLNPSADGSGFSFSLAPRWGGSAFDTGAIWAEQGVLNQGLNQFGSVSGDAMEARLAYGKRILGERFMLTPFVDVDSSDNNRQYLIGARLDQLVKSSANLNLDFALGRVERRSTGEAGAQVGLNASLRF